MENTHNLPAIRALRPALNKGRIVGQKRPLMPKHVWAIRVRLELAEAHRDLALFNMAIDSKLRGCDLVRMKVIDVMASGQIKERASVMQSKTQKPVRFEISEGTRASLDKWMEDPIMVGSEYLWPGRFHERLHISTRQYARILREWITSIGLEATAYGTHSMRRTKVTQIYKKTGNLRAVQLAAWSHENGQHGTLSWCRIRGCIGHFRGYRDLIKWAARKGGPHQRKYQPRV